MGSRDTDNMGYNTQNEDKQSKHNNSNDEHTLYI